MEKGFNDDELADIMNEIESLEQEFTNSEAQVENNDMTTDTNKEPLGDAKKVSSDHSHQDEHHKVLDDLAHMHVEQVVPEKHSPAYDDNIHHMKQQDAPKEKTWSSTVQETHKPQEKHESLGHSSMSFNVEGDMKVDLNFCVGGQFIHLHVSDHGLEIELDGGAKFSLPLSDVREKKVA